MPIISQENLENYVTEKQVNKYLNQLPHLTSVCPFCVLCQFFQRLAPIPASKSRNPTNKHYICFKGDKIVFRIIPGFEQDYTREVLGANLKFH